MRQYVILSHTPWTAVPTRTQQLATRLGEAQVLFFQSAADDGDRSYRQEGKQVRPQVTLYTLPPDGPLAERAGFFQRRAARRQADFVQKQMGRHGFREPVLWLTCPDQRPFADLLAYRGLVYDCDRFWPPELDDRESELALAADVIFAASPLLKRRLSPCSSNVALLPFGCNYPMFAKDDLPTPPALERLPRPVLGYAGTVWADLDLSPLVAAARALPRCSFVLVGRAERNPFLAELEALPNVTLLGPVAPVDLPDYLCAFDVCLYLLRRSELGDDILHARMYEYLSTGKPVVSMLHPDQPEDFPDVVYSARSEAEFVRLCRRALEEDPAWVAPRRRAHGAEAAWSRRAAEVRRILSAIGL